MKIVFLVILTFLLASCSGNIDASKFLAERDSIMDVNERQQQELDEVNALMSEVANCLDSIAEQERFLYVSEEGVKLPRKMVLENLRAFEDLLNRQRNQIAMLQDSLYNRKDTASRYFKIIDFLNKELAEKDLTIQTLQKEIASHKRNITDLQARQSELEKNVSDLQAKEEIHTAALRKQDEILNEGYIKIATKKELQNEGLLVGGLFSKKKVDYTKLDKKQFMAIDIRQATEIPMKAKRIKILTPEPPETSYRLEASGENIILQILDPTAFWQISNFLIIQTN